MWKLEIVSNRGLCIFIKRIVRGTLLRLGILCSDVITCGPEQKLGPFFNSTKCIVVVTYRAIPGGF